MRIIGIIPARYHSSRFPGKPLVEIEGKSMIRHVYERARQCRSLDRLLVATDDRRILETVRSFGGDCLVTREDHESGTDRLAEACERLNFEEPDIIINIQGDEPMLEPEMIELLIGTLHAFPDRCMGTLAFPSQNQEEYTDPNVVKVVLDKEGKALYFSRSPLPRYREVDIAKVEFLKHLGFYAYRCWFLRVFTNLPRGMLEQAEKLEQLRALEHGYPIHVALSTVETHGVDTPEDLNRLFRLSRL